MCKRLVLIGVAALFSAVPAPADSIVIGGVMYDNVVVREGPSQYYVQIPSDGRTISAPKSDVKPQDVVRLKSKSEREALLQEWTKNNALRDKAKGADAKQEPKGAKRLAPTGISSDPEEKAPSYGPEPTGAVQHVRSAAGGSTVETGTFGDEKGFKRLVVKGSRQKDEGFETRVERQRAQMREDAEATQQEDEGMYPVVPEAAPQPQQDANAVQAPPAPTPPPADAAGEPAGGGEPAP